MRSYEKKSFIFEFYMKFRLGKTGAPKLDPDSPYPTYSLVVAAYEDACNKVEDDYASPARISWRLHFF